MPQFEEDARIGISLPILLYHHIGYSESGASRGLTVSPGRFEGQMRLLKGQGYSTITPSDWVAFRKGCGILPPRPIMLTFDDAYADLNEFALPVLLRYRLTGVVMVVTGLIGQTNVWDRESNLPRRALMSGADIRKWSRAGIEFGAHGRTHQDLTVLGQNELAGEIRGSRKDLEELLQLSVYGFAYPYGYVNQQAVALVRDNFSLAFTTVEGLNPPWASPLQLRRSKVEPDDHLMDVALRARWGWSPLQRSRTLLARTMKFLRGV